MAEMEMIRQPPAGPLADAVEAYIGYRESGSTPGIHRGLPSGRLTFIVTIDDPCDVVAQPEGAESPGRFRALVGGLHTTPALISHQGYQHGVQLDLSPLAARALLGMPAGALSPAAIDLDAVLGHVGSELWERVAAAPSWPERFAVLDEVLSHRAIDASGERHGSAAPEVEWAWRMLCRSGGNVTVTTLAAEVGWSRRHLTEKFRDEFGLTPKVAGRVLRFDRARHLLPNRRGDLAAVAAECGYADQAHMIRDFNQFCGCPPTQWLADEHASEPTLTQLVTA